MRPRMIALNTKIHVTMLILLGALGMPGGFPRPSSQRPSSQRPSSPHRPTRNHAVAEEHHHAHSERGDVPGWVLVTLMTAGLVIAIWAVAGPALINVFNTALTRILSI